MTSMKLEEKKKKNKSLLKLNRCIAKYTGLTIKKSTIGWQFIIVDVSRAV